MECYTSLRLGSWCGFSNYSGRGSLLSESINDKGRESRPCERCTGASVKGRKYLQIQADTAIGIQIRGNRDPCWMERDPGCDHQESFRCSLTTTMWWKHQSKNRRMVTEQDRRWPPPCLQRYRYISQNASAQMFSSSRLSCALEWH